MIKKLTDLGQEIFMSRYAYPGETKWSERAKASARAVASAESDEDKVNVEKAFYETISSGDLVPGGRIIYGSGRNAGKHNLLNCYVIIPEDTVDSIGKTILHKVYRLRNGLLHALALGKLLDQFDDEVGVCRAGGI
jgi:ribonucleotide reductase alpha subunit